jgi:hypothetical protein
MREPEVSVPIDWKIWFRSVIEFADEVQLLLPPTVSEKNFVASEAICCIAEQAEM